MAARKIIPQLTRSATRFSSITKTATPSIASQCQRSGMATVVPPVMQDATSAQGPTAMVFMNMGGPQTTDQVGDFLSRLFVCSRGRNYMSRANHPHSGRRRSYTLRTTTKLPRTSHLAQKNSKDSETVRSDRWRIAHKEMVRTSMRRDVQNPGPDITADCTTQALRCL